MLFLTTFVVNSVICKTLNGQIVETGGVPEEIF